MTLALLQFLAGLAQETDADFLDDAGRIIGSPTAGPKPEHGGDRGGWAQFATLGFLVVGVSFIAWRIRRSMVAAQAARS
ncbi:MAG: hypothetical protein AAGA90_09865 [Actinomycetota bacterium]